MIRWVLLILVLTSVAVPVAAWTRYRDAAADRDAQATAVIHARAVVTELLDAPTLGFSAVDPTQETEIVALVNDAVRGAGLSVAVLRELSTRTDPVRGTGGDSAMVQRTQGVFNSLAPAEVGTLLAELRSGLPSATITEVRMTPTATRGDVDRNRFDTMVVMERVALRTTEETQR